MLIKENHKVTEFRNTTNQKFGGWMVYFKLFVDGLKIIKQNRNTLGLKKHKVVFLKISLLLQAIFKPLKQFYKTKTVLFGTVDIISQDNVVISILRKTCCKKITNHYVFGILIFITNKTLSDSELFEIVKK